MTTQGSITIYNRRTGPDRRDLYYPTEIQAASYAERIASEHAKSATANAPKYMIRIPFDAGAQSGNYVAEAAYRTAPDPSGLWTLQHLDLVTRGAPVVGRPSTEAEVKEAAAAAGITVITVSEYADNTFRGSAAVRHWRIGGV